MSFRPAVEDLEARTVPAAVGTPNQNFVDQLYRDVLGRAPDAGSAGFVAALNRGADREDVVDGILDSAEGRRVRVNALYVRFLGRTADAGGLAFWSNFLRSNSDLDLAARLIGSREYFQTQGGGTDEGFLGAVYQDVLGRSIDVREVRDRDDDVRGGVRARVEFAEDVLESDEAGTARVRAARGFLPGVRLTADQVEDLADGDGLAFARELLSSPAYFNRAQVVTPVDFTTPPFGNPTA